MLPYVLGVAMFLTVAVLFVGVVTFAFNAQINAKYGTKLMSARVILQGLAIALFALLMLTGAG
jgi:hypothetical protein